MSDARDDATGHRADVRSVISMHVDELDLTVRASNCLHTAAITRVIDLIQMTPEELLAIRNMGTDSVHVVESALAVFGLHLGTSSEDVSAMVFHDFDAFIHAMELLGVQGINSAPEVTRMTADELLAVPGFDKVSLKAVEDGLQRWGLSLRAPDYSWVRYTDDENGLKRWALRLDHEFPKGAGNTQFE